MASRNPSQRAKGSRNGGKVCAMIRRETGRATGSREIVGSWNLSPLMKNGNLLLKANFCGLTLLTAKSDWPGASLEKIKKHFQESMKQENGGPLTQLMEKEHGGGMS